MGRHSRRGPAPQDDAGDIGAQRDQRPPAPGAPAPYEARQPGPRAGAQGQDAPRLPDGTPARGVPRLPAQAARRAPEGTPAHGIPRLPDGTPARGVPPAAAGPTTRGGHPQQREPGGGWGEFAGSAGTDTAPGTRKGPAGAAPFLPRQRQGGRRRSDGGPRQEYLDAFEEDGDVFAPRPGTGGSRRPGVPGARHPHDAGEPAGAGDGAPPASASVPAQRGGNKGRAFTGIAAAAVTTVLAVVVAGQVADRHDGGETHAQSATGQARDARAPGQDAPSTAPDAGPLTYEQKMDRTYPLAATLKASGKFEAVPGADKAPGKGQKYTYRVDVEQGLGLDGALFAEAVQKTLNDDRSWAHGGTRTFERVSSGKPDFVITLASPGTTAEWCAKSGLDTTEDNVSCDSASTERVMINAYRWAQGSKTYGDKIHAYRQMLINHEVGHRLGHGHVTCQKNGELAPVMQQQTKFLDHDGIHCLPNPWPYPRS
ncbi:DUF3152 domain-containing protein [Streptomyces collinus]|uniref:DUF3152 domain-containing protein n=1 Tax=Streptomyces collinus TaxID=42684 RepID=UPI0033D8BBC2